MMKLTRSQVVLIIVLVTILLLAGISVPVGFYLYNQYHHEEDHQNGNLTSSTSTTSTTPGPMKAKIITDLKHVQDTLQKFSDDVATLLTTPKLFREEVEHFKTSTMAPNFEAIEAENDGNSTTHSSAVNTTVTTTTISSTTVANNMSDFEILTEIMDVKLELVNNVSRNILDHQPLSSQMDQNLQALNGNFSLLDEKMVNNITLSDKADIDLAHILIGKFNGTLNTIQSSLDYLQDVTPSSTVSTTSTTMTTSQTFESLAVSKLKATNETFDIMIEKLAELVHPTTKSKLKNDQFSQFYDDSVDLIQTLNDTRDSLNVTHGLVTSTLLKNITLIQNQTSILSNQLQNMANLTSADQDLAVESVARFNGAQITIGATIDIIQGEKTTTASTSSSPRSSPNFNQDMFQRLARSRKHRSKVDE